MNRNFNVIGNFIRHRSDNKIKTIINVHEAELQLRIRTGANGKYVCQKSWTPSVTKHGDPNATDHGKEGPHPSDTKKQGRYISPQNFEEYSRSIQVTMSKAISDNDFPSVITLFKDNYDNKSPPMRIASLVNCKRPKCFFIIAATKQEAEAIYNDLHSMQTPPLQGMVNSFMVNFDV